jgi:hypothetical protein
MILESPVIKKGPIDFRRTLMPQIEVSAAGCRVSGSPCGFFTLWLAAACAAWQERCGLTDELVSYIRAIASASDPPIYLSPREAERKRGRQGVIG